MKLFKNSKKSGFTLMEVAIAVMIVGLLTVICIPVVQRQLEKSDEYAYYMAYRSVEKLGGQIVALGDPDPNSIYNKTSSSNDIKLALDKPSALQTLKNKIVITFSTLGERFAYTEKYLFKNLFPKSFAENDFVEYGYVEGGMYSNVNYAYRVCKGGETIQQQEPSGVDAEGNPTYKNYKCSDFGVSDSDFNSYALIRSLLPTRGCFVGLTEAQENARLAQLENFVKNDKSVDGDLTGFCNKINSSNYCAGLDASTGEEYKVAPDTVTAREEDTGDGDFVDQEYTITYCRHYAKSPEGGGASGSGDAVQLERPKVTDTCKPAHGYYGMYNSGGDYALSCECISGKLPTQNNDKVCCPQLTGLNSYSRSDISPSMSEPNYCVNCEGDFNSVGNWCCPAHSVFNGTACQCVEGYEMDSAKGTKNEKCVKTKCAKGSHLDAETEVCVPNPPLLKADRFCELIKDNWNHTSPLDSCNKFTTQNNARIYTEVLDAAKSASGNYLSIQSKIGAFRNVAPNIILSNGLKLWILGDKAASIPGLSYNPMHISSTQNMCQEILNGNKPLSTKDKCDARGGYFCKGEAHCYTLDAQSLTTMGDARNCCVASDISDLAYDVNSAKDNRAFAVSGFTVFVDINGDKGSGTLWEDVFPFFVGANGKVYPGYPLDADKAKDTTSEAIYLGGNSVKNLPVDVYYYDKDASNENARKKVVVFSNVSYARGLCFGKILNSHTPYCQNLGLKAKNGGTRVDKIKDAIDSASNDCKTHNCFITVRNKLRFF